ncbi:uncharacterized protein LOC129919171 [Episyrphus balteatus]|uniref:uncharacterized protein LOC129919171 n=1 Tax=Episyrphus balteatus TaxID=286459 RepID=UPI002484DFAD|nr:uncharacterized protein LOC129919171 [Episyrphus balteatus]
MVDRSKRSRLLLLITPPTKECSHKGTSSVLSFNCVNERLTTIRIKAKFTNISLICAHSPTEEKDDTTKDNFYELLEKTYEQIPSYDIKIVLGDFNAKLGREDIFGSTVGKHSLHDNTSDNGFRLVDFAAGQNVVIASTRFPYLKIHKGTWKSPDQSTVNQIDHIAIDARHSSSIMDVRTFRGANIDSDYYLVVANVRMRISRPSPTQENTVRKFNVGRLQSQEIARSYSNRVSNNLLRSPMPPAASIDNQWQHCQEAIRDAASEVLGFTRPPQRNPWFDDECRQAHVAKQKAYKAALHRRTRAANELYKRKRTEEHRLLRRKKRQHEKEAIVEIEGCYNRNEVRKFYQKVKRTSQGYRPRTEAYKDQQGNIVVETQAMLRIWKDHFCNLYNGDDEANPAQRQIAPFNIDDEGQHFRPPDLEEVKAVISKLKSNKVAGADGLAAELFKAAGDDLVRSMHQLICRIWSEESMPTEWNLSIVCPILKKGDPLTCANYRGISLLNISYKILSAVLCERLKPFVNNLIGPYQCGFRPGKSTIDQIFTLRQILEKTQEQQIDTHHLFIDFKAEYDSIYRDELYRAMSSFGIPANAG